MRHCASLYAHIARGRLLVLSKKAKHCASTEALRLWSWSQSPCQVVSAIKKDEALCLSVCTHCAWAAVSPIKKGEALRLWSWSQSPCQAVSPIKKGEALRLWSWSQSPCQVVSAIKKGEALCQHRGIAPMVVESISVPSC